MGRRSRPTRRRSRRGPRCRAVVLRRETPSRSSAVNPWSEAAVPIVRACRSGAVPVDQPRKRELDQLLGIVLRPRATTSGRSFRTRSRSASAKVGRTTTSAMIGSASASLRTADADRRTRRLLCPGRQVRSEIVDGIGNLRARCGCRRLRPACRRSGSRDRTFRPDPTPLPALERELEVNQRHLVTGTIHTCRPFESVRLSIAGKCSAGAGRRQAASSGPAPAAGHAAERGRRARDEDADTGRRTGG